MTVLDLMPNTEELIVNCLDYHKNSIKPRGFEEFCEMYGGPHKSLWELKSYDKITGRVNQRIWTPNVITDNGAISMLKNTWNNAGSAVAIFNHVVVSPNGCTTKTTAATGTSPITSISVTALVNGLANGKTLTLGYGGSNAQTITLNATANAGDTTLTVVSFTPAVNFPIGTDICAIPAVTDNPSSVSGTVDSGALSGGAFTFNATTGLGNRNVVIVATITGTAGNAGTYTEAYTSNNATIGTGTTGSHVIIPGFVINSSTNEQITLTEKA